MKCGNHPSVARSTRIHHKYTKVQAVIKPTQIPPQPTKKHSPLAKPTGNPAKKLPGYTKWSPKKTFYLPDPDRITLPGSNAKPKNSKGHKQFQKLFQINITNQNTNPKCYTHTDTYIPPRTFNKTQIFKPQSPDFGPKTHPNTNASHPKPKHTSKVN